LEEKQDDGDLELLIAFPDFTYRISGCPFLFAFAKG
jgi:hypothetical protein